MRWELQVAHGALMFIGFGVFLPVGALIARYGKSTSTAVGPRPTWFRIHTALQSFGFVVVLAAFILAVVSREKYGDDGDDDDDDDGHFSGTHGGLGIAAFVLAFVQASQGMLKAQGEGPCDKVLRIVHRALGYSALVIATVAMFTGFYQLEPHAPRVLVGLYAGWVGLLFLVGVVIVVVIVSRRRRQGPSTQLASPVTGAPASSTAV
jgi:protein-S-isoprenylcysteine O-methyltransferase Ste14